MNEGRFSDIYQRLFDAYRERSLRRGELSGDHFKLQRIAGDVRRLSIMFTGRAVSDRSYMDDHRLRMAYVDYYVYPNMLKVIRVLREMTRYTPSFFRDGLRVLDLGCGPGTGMLGLLLALRDEGMGLPHFTAVDRSAGALNAAAFLVETLGGMIECPLGGVVETRRNIPEESRYDLVIAANAVGEMGLSRGMKLIERHLAPGGYGVIIEPALKAATRGLMETIAWWTSRGYRIAAPCLAVATCPMLADKELWCHQDREWERPPFMREIDLRAGLRKESLKYSYLVVTRSGGTPGESRSGCTRIVSDLHGRAAKWWAYGCPHGGGALSRLKFAGTPENLPRRGEIIPLTMTDPR